MNKFAGTLIDVRNALGLSQVDLAKRLGVTAECVSQWENDRRRPDYDRIQKVIDAFGVDPRKLFYTYEDRTHDADPEKEDPPAPPD